MRQFAFAVKRRYIEVLTRQMHIIKNESMKSIISAIQFLTVLPLGMKTDEKDLGRSIPWFPVAGLCVGGGSALVYWAAIRLQIPIPVSSCIAILSLTVLSGGLHLDGLADSADGLFSHRPPERIIEIMKDSRIGTMGVLALIFALLLKWLALSSLEPKLAIPALILVPCASRAAMSVSLAIFPCARQDGLAKLFISHRHPIDILFSAAIAIAAGWFCLHVDGTIMAIIPVLTGVAFSFYCKNKIGGITGDTLGSVSELGETAAFLAAVILFCR